MAFCVDSASYSHLGLYDQVVATWGVPAAWARYLPNYAITPDEVAFLRGKGARILPIFNDENATSVGYGTAYGRDAGQTAARAWKALGCPEGCAVYIDVETAWAPSGQFLAGWFEGCRDEGMVGGVYLNPVGGSGHAAAYQQARALTPGIPAVYWTSENEYQQYAASRLDALPLGGIYAAPVPGYGRECAVWQYSENQLDGTVDLDVANDLGLSLLWGAVPVTTVAVRGQRLKPLPNKFCPASSPHLPVGTVVAFTPDKGGRETTPHYAHVTVRGGPDDGRSGWILRKILRTTYP